MKAAMSHMLGETKVFTVTLPLEVYQRLIAYTRSLDLAYPGTAARIGLTRFLQQWDQERTVSADTHKEAHEGDHDD